MLGQILGAVVGAGLNAGFGAIQNEWAAGRTAQDRRENYKYGEMAANEADKRTRAIYSDIYSPGALVKQYNDAGLSPSMMAGGMPGGGGMSGAHGTGAAGMQTPYMPMSLLEGAQISNLVAQAEKTKAETKTIEESREASISNILADTGHKQASTAVAEAEAAGIALDNYVKENTKNASIYRICEEAEEAGHRAQKAFEEMRSAKVLADVDEATLAEQIELKKKAVQSLAQSISESKATVRLKDQERRKVYNDILQAWEQLEINWKGIEVEQQQADTYTNWIEKQIPIIEQQLEVKFKELDIEKKRMIIDAVTGTIKSLAFGAMAAASFKGGQGSIQPNPVKLEPKYNSRQATQNRKYTITKNKEAYAW